MWCLSNGNIDDDDAASMDDAAEVGDFARGREGGVKKSVMIEKKEDDDDGNRVKC